MVDWLSDEIISELDRLGLWDRVTRPLAEVFRELAESKGQPLSSIDQDGIIDAYEKASDERFTPGSIVSANLRDTVRRFATSGSSSFSEFVSHPENLPARSLERIRLTLINDYRQIAENFERESTTQDPARSTVAGALANEARKVVDGLEGLKLSNIDDKGRFLYGVTCLWRLEELVKMLRHSESALEGEKFLSGVLFAYVKIGLPPWPMFNEEDLEVFESMRAGIQIASDLHDFGYEIIVGWKDALLTVLKVTLAHLEDAVGTFNVVLASVLALEGVEIGKITHFIEQQMREDETEGDIPSKIQNAFVLTANMSILCLTDYEETELAVKLKKLLINYEDWALFVSVLASRAVFLASSGRLNDVRVAILKNVADMFRIMGKKLERIKEIAREDSATMDTTLFTATAAVYPIFRRGVEPYLIALFHPDEQAELDRATSLRGYFEGFAQRQRNRESGAESHETNGRGSAGGDARRRSRRVGQRRVSGISARSRGRIVRNMMRGRGNVLRRA